MVRDEERSAHSHADGAGQDGREGRTHRRGRDQQHDEGQYPLDHLSAQSLPSHRAHATAERARPAAVRNSPMDIAGNPAGEHRVEKQGAVTGADRGRQRHPNAEGAGDHPPPPGRADGGRGGQHDGRRQRGERDRAQPVAKRGLPELPPQQQEDDQAAGHPEQRQANPAHGWTMPERHDFETQHTEGTGPAGEWFTAVSAVPSR
jgi:hypothetical protein